MPMFNGKRVIGSYEALNDLPPNKKYFLCSKTGQYFEQFEDFCNHQLFLKTNSFYPFTAQDNVKKQKLTYDQARAIEEQAFDDISAISAGLRNGIFYLIQHCIVRYSVSDALHDIYQFTNNRYFLDEQVLWEDEGAFKQATVVGVNLIPTDILNEMVSPDLVTYDLQVNQQNQVFKISNVTFNNIHRDSTVIKASYVRNLILFCSNWYKAGREKIEISDVVRGKAFTSNTSWEDIFAGAEPKFPITLEKVDVVRHHNTPTDWSPEDKRKRIEMIAICEKLNAYFINPVLYEVHQFSTQKISEKTLIGLRQLLRVCELDERQDKEDLICTDIRPSIKLSRIPLSTYMKDKDVEFKQILDVYNFFNTFHRQLWDQSIMSNRYCTFKLFLETHMCCNPTSSAFGPLVTMLLRQIFINSLDSGKNSIIDNRNNCLQASIILEKLWAPSCEGIVLSNYEVSYHIQLYLATISNNDPTIIELQGDLSGNTVFDLEACQRTEILLLLIKYCLASSNLLRGVIENSHNKIFQLKQKYNDLVKGSMEIGDENSILKKIARHSTITGRHLIGQDRYCRNVYFFSSIGAVLIETPDHSLPFPCGHKERHTFSCPLYDQTTPNHLYYIKDASEWRQFVGSLKKNTHREGNLLKNLKYLGKYIENVLAQGSEFMDFLSTLSPEDEWSKDYYGDSWTVVAKEALLSIVKDILEYSSVRYLSNIRKWKDQFDGNTVDLNNYLVDNVSATDESVLLMLIPFMLVLDEKEKEIKGEELIHRNDTDITLEEIQAMKMQAKTLTKNHELLNIMNLFKNTVDWNRRIIFLKCEICNYQYAKNMELIRCQSCRKTYHYNCIPFKCYDEYRYCSSCYSLDSALELMPLEHQKGLQDYVIDVEDSNQLISPLPLSSENILEIKSILGTLSKNPVAHHFIKVINALDYPDYYDYISHVMCIEIIQSNLENDCYSSTQDILRDVKLMTDNALLFNGYNHYVSLCARKIETYLVTKLVNL